MAHATRILLLLCTILMAASGLIGQGRGGGESSPGRKVEPFEWRRYTVKGEEFSVQLPTLPAMTTSKVFQVRLRKTRLERQLTTTLEGVAYTIDVFENPKPRQSLGEFVAEQTRSTAFDFTTERTLNVNGFAGKEYSYRSKTTVATVQFFATEKRLYRFLATGSPAEHAGVKQFFSSIVLGKNTEGMPVEDGPGAPLELATGERIFLSREVDTKPRLLTKPDPSYTEKARQNELTGTVVLRMVFRGDGEITNIQVISGLRHGLTDKAIEAARKIKFIPAMKNGKPVSVWMQLEYNFNLY